VVGRCSRKRGSVISGLCSNSAGSLLTILRAAARQRGGSRAREPAAAPSTRRPDAPDSNSTAGSAPCMGQVSVDRGWPGLRRLACAPCDRYAGDGGPLASVGVGDCSGAGSPAPEAAGHTSAPRSGPYRVGPLLGPSHYPTVMSPMSSLFGARLGSEPGACDRTQYGEGWLRMTARLTIFPSRSEK
jgi:hypothetical protein